MGARERGFTLLELAIAVGILALLAAAGAWAFSLHPDALASATDDVDAALASARAIASASGNGATVVFAPRTAGAGFSVRVYTGRPNAPGAVVPTNAMPVVADANVHEAKLGDPPFAIFIDSAGDASGQAAYPAFDAGGAARFSVIAQEPACPSGGFVLTISIVTPPVSRTRALPCRNALSTAGSPDPSPTPNVPIVTPTALLFHWPADVQQPFVATEWGYTHWFASSAGFACGNGVAAFPNVLPSPYSEPPSLAEAGLAPSPPPDAPYSYPNSGGASMNDAPAAFPLQPRGAGLCSATVEDAFGQSASTAIAVMGWLTATYGSTAVTHAAGTLAVPATALPAAGSSVTIALAKSFDSAALSPQVAFTGSSAVPCAADINVSNAAGSMPPTRSSAPSTASLTFTVVALPPSAMNCTGVIFNHYADAGAPSDAAAEAGEGVSFTLSLAPPTGALSTLGKIVFWLPSGSGGACSYAQLYLENGNADANAPNSTDAFNETDANGCVTNDTVKLWATEPNYSGVFDLVIGSCGPSINPAALSWSASSSTALAPASSTPSCLLEVQSTDRSLSSGGARSVSAIVNSCSGATMSVGIGSACSITLPLSWGEPPDCTPGGSGGEYVTVKVTEDPTPMLGTLTLVGSTQTEGTYLWTRTAPGTQTISYIELDEVCHHTASYHGTITLN